jgi:hypothetical protein
VDFDCRNYNVKCEYYKGIITSIYSLIQTCDDHKPLTSNVGITIAGIFFGNNSSTSTLDHLIQDVLNLIKE